MSVLEISPQVQEKFQTYKVGSAFRYKTDGDLLNYLLDSLEVIECIADGLKGCATVCAPPQEPTHIRQQQNKTENDIELASRVQRARKTTPTSKSRKSTKPGCNTKKAGCGTSPEPLRDAVETYVSNWRASVRRSIRISQSPPTTGATKRRKTIQSSDRAAKPLSFTPLTVIKTEPIDEPLSLPATSAVPSNGPVVPNNTPVVPSNEPAVPSNEYTTPSNGPTDLGSYAESYDSVSIMDTLNIRKSRENSLVVRARDAFAFDCLLPEPGYTSNTPPETPPFLKAIAPVRGKFGSVHWREIETPVPEQLHQKENSASDLDYPGRQKKTAIICQRSSVLTKNSADHIRDHIRRPHQRTARKQIQCVKASRLTFTQPSNPSSTPSNDLRPHQKAAKKQIQCLKASSLTLTQPANPSSTPSNESIAVYPLAVDHTYSKSRSCGARQVVPVVACRSRIQSEPSADTATKIALGKSVSDVPKRFTRFVITPKRLTPLQSSSVSLITYGRKNTTVGKPKEILTNMYTTSARVGCNVCYMMFDSKAEFHKHIKTVSTSREYDPLTHQRKTVSQTRENDPLTHRKTIQCSFCKSLFSSTKNLSDHQMNACHALITGTWSNTPPRTGSSNRSPADVIKIANAPSHPEKRPFDADIRSRLASTARNSAEVPDVDLPKTNKRLFSDIVGLPCLKNTHKRRSFGNLFSETCSTCKLKFCECFILGKKYKTSYKKKASKPYPTASSTEPLHISTSQRNIDVPFPFNIEIPSLFVGELQKNQPLQPDVVNCGRRVADSLIVTGKSSRPTVGSATSVSSEKHEHITALPEQAPDSATENGERNVPDFTYHESLEPPVSTTCQTGFSGAERITGNKCTESETLPVIKMESTPPERSDFNDRPRSDYVLVELENLIDSHHDPTEKDSHGSAENDPEPVMSGCTPEKTKVVEPANRSVVRRHLSGETDDVETDVETDEDTGTAVDEPIDTDDECDMLLNSHSHPPGTSSATGVVISPYSKSKAANARFKFNTVPSSDMESDSEMPNEPFDTDDECGCSVSESESESESEVSSEKSGSYVDPPKTFGLNVSVDLPNVGLDVLSISSGGESDDEGICTDDECSLSCNDNQDIEPSEPSAADQTTLEADYNRDSVPSTKACTDSHMCCSQTTAREDNFNVPSTQPSTSNILSNPLGDLPATDSPAASSSMSDVSMVVNYDTLVSPSSNISDRTNQTRDSAGVDEQYRNCNQTSTATRDNCEVTVKIAKRKQSFCGPCQRYFKNNVSLDMHQRKFHSIQ